MFPPHAVIITAAGSSERFNASSTQNDQVYKKEFLPLDGHSILFHSASPFFSIPNLKAFVVTYKAGLEAQTRLALEEISLQTEVPVLLVEGGESRRISVFKALEELEKHQSELGIEFVSIHDGARPFVKPELIISCLANAAIFGGAAPVVNISDALKRVDSNGLICEHLDRNGVFGVQTPQTFAFPAILQAHKAAPFAVNYQDDTQIFTEFGGKVVAVPSDSSNRKITYINDIPEDNK